MYLDIAYSTKTGEIFKVGGDVHLYCYVQGKAGNPMAATNPEIGAQYGVAPDLLTEHSPDGNAARLLLSERVQDRAAASNVARMAKEGRTP